MGLPGKETGIRQRVYLPVRRQLTYVASVYLKHISGPEDVTLSLRNRDRPDEVLASANVVAASPEWKKYIVTLNLPVAKIKPLEPSDFAISVHDDARVVVDQVSLMPADNLDGLDPDEVAMARDLHSPLVRFGGNFTSAYDWRDGVGPRDQRISKSNVSWGIPEYNTFGTDEFLHFCRLIHADPQIAHNLGSDTPEHAAEWVKYVNDRWPRSNGSHSGGLLWELGNELWGDFQVGYPSLERVAAKTLATADAIHRIDRSVRLIATGADEDHFSEWNAAQLSNPPGTFDYLSTHFVVGDRLMLKDATNEFTVSALLALPIGLEGKLKAMHEQIQASEHRDRVRTAFTEWLLTAHDAENPNFNNMGGAVFAGGFLNAIIRNSEIVPISDMTGIMEFGGIWKKRGIVFATPAYWVLHEYANAGPTSLLSVMSDSPTYSIANGSRRLPEIHDVPYLDIVAATAENGRELLFFCVNRHPRHSLAADFDLVSLERLKPEATISTLQAKSLMTTNSEDAPDTVKPVRSHETFKGPFRHVFPPRSVTVIALRFQ
jgi:alpha-N-arabinofuranosidase